MPVLYIAGVSLSNNPLDISPVTLRRIKEASVIIGEERKGTYRLIKASGCNPENKKIFFINEHSDDNDRKEVLKEVNNNDTSVFFSDAGTPCISDPDYKFIKMAREEGVTLKSLPGPSSITTALSLSGIDSSQFFFAGFPPRENVKRKNFFKKIFSSSVAVVVLERPYALEPFIKDTFPYGRKYFISVSIGCEDEINISGFPSELAEKLKGIKAPFTVVIPPKN